MRYYGILAFRYFCLAHGVQDGPHTCAKPFDLNDAVSPFRSKRPQKDHVILTSKTKRKINRCCKIRKSYFSNNDVSFFKSREKLSKLFGAYFLGICLVHFFFFFNFFVEILKICLCSIFSFSAWSGYITSCFIKKPIELCYFSQRQRNS